MNTPQAPKEDRPWRRNLYVSAVGSFATIIGMTLILPFLPLYVRQLGAGDNASAAALSGIAYAATFFAAALISPFWGKLADRYGRKPMLIRASLGMAVAIALTGVAQDIPQLIFFRLLTGFLGGYASGAIALVAAQTPRERTTFALSVLSTGIIAGNLTGPLLGGMLPPLIGIRSTFFLSSALIFIAFLGTIWLLKEDKVERAAAREHIPGPASPSLQAPVLYMFATGFLLLFANTALESVLALFVERLIQDPGHTTAIAGLVVAAGAFGAFISTMLLGKLADRIGPLKVMMGGLIAAACLTLPQAFVQNEWQLLILRFLAGASIGGLLPCIATVIRHNVTEGAVGRALGYSTSVQYCGQVFGPLTGGAFVAGLGWPPLFALNALVLVLAAGCCLWCARHMARIAGGASGPV